MGIEQLLSDRHTILPDGCKTWVNYYQSVSTGGWSTSFSRVENCEWRPIHRRREPGDNSITIDVRRREWFLWKSQMPSSLSPKERDKIIDSTGAVWIVDSSDVELIGNRWRLQCTKGV